MTASAAQAAATFTPGASVVFERSVRQGDGQHVESFNAVVLGTITEDNHLGSNGEPAISLAYLNPQKHSLLGGADWREAFERVTPVKHQSHDDLASGKETQHYYSVADCEVEEVGLQPSTPIIDLDEIQKEYFKRGYDAGKSDACADPAASEDAPTRRQAASEDATELTGSVAPSTESADANQQAAATENDSA